jgi:hypothetical protein
MTETLELPDGTVVTPDDVFLYSGYPYRFRPREDEYAFELVPLYWGDSDLDVPFTDRSALVDQWDDASQGPLSASEWEQWLASAREDDRYDDAEVDALARELPVDTDSTGDDDGLVARVRRVLGR